MELSRLTPSNAEELLFDDILWVKKARTTPMAVEMLAAALFAAAQATRVIAVELPRSHAFMHLDTVMTMIDRDTFVAYPYLDTDLRSWTLTPGEAPGSFMVDGNADLFASIAEALEVDKILRWMPLVGEAVPHWHAPAELAPADRDRPQGVEQGHRSRARLADILTMREHSSRHLDEISYCYLGDARNNTARSLLVTGALLGMDVRIAAPKELWPDEDLRVTAAKIAETTGARMLVTDEVAAAVRDVDYLYTDIWVSMGEPVETWDTRVALLLPYQVNAAMVALTGNPRVSFMHCLPALHNRDTTIGEQLYQRTGLSALEVTDEVFESDRSIVFDQAENRLHTIKAIMVATLGG